MIDANDPLARYLLSRSHFSRLQDRVKPSAFMPPSDLKLSVFRIAGLAEREVWSIGQRYVADPQAKKVYGRADVLVSHVCHG
jgi:hypothetical protein